MNDDLSYLEMNGIRFVIDRPVFIGRERGCDIRIDDATLSRRHACVVDSRAGCTLIDLNSRNGTSVNGCMVQAVMLADGDIITLGEHKIVFRNPSPGACLPDSGPLQSTDDLVGRALEEDTLKLLRSGALAGEDPATRLLILYKVARKINSCLDSSTLFSKVVDLAIEVLGADRAIIALKSPTGELVPRAHSSYTTREETTLSGQSLSYGADGKGSEFTTDEIPDFSNSVAHHCLAEGSPVFIADAVCDERFGQAASISKLNIASVMCVPLIHRAETLGVLYVDKRIENRPFKKEDLKMLAALAEQAALALANQRLYSRLQSSLDKIRRQQEALVQSEKLAAMGLLSAGLSHEIRNPLTVLTGNLELLGRMAQGKLDRSAFDEMEMLNACSRAADQILALVQGLIDFSRKRPDNTELLCPNSVLLDTLATVKLLLTKHYGVKIIKELDRNLPRVQADKRELIQVFMNLIVNAVQAMPEGGRLLIRTTSVPGNRVSFVFIDEGLGIPEEQLENLFQPFFTTKSEGTGLGLWISQQIIERLGGTIRASNNEKAGARFEVVLPAVDRREPED